MFKIKNLLLVSLLILFLGLSACKSETSTVAENDIASNEVSTSVIDALLIKQDNAQVVAAFAEQEDTQGGEMPIEQVEILAIELQQIILPDGHPEFPLETVWVVVPAEPAHFEVPIPVTIPESWAGKYVIDQQANTANYLYIVAPDQQERLFSITALTEAEWQAIQNEPHGEALLNYGGIVWVYNPALENRLSGAQADEFSRMVGEAYEMADSLAGYFTPVIDTETLLPYLQSYFDVLAAGNYAEAGQIFGGDLQTLADMNPDVSSDNRAALFERACTTNGFLCNLQIGEIVKVQKLSSTAMQFTLTLRNPDGSPFELGPCCGADPTTSPSQTEFVYTMDLQNGSFKVFELPVYQP